MEYGIAIDGIVQEQRFETPEEAFAVSRIVRAENPGSRVAPIDVARYLSR